MEGTDEGRRLGASDSTVGGTEGVAEGTALGTSDSEDGISDVRLVGAKKGKAELLGIELGPSLSMVGDSDTVGSMDGT